MVTPGASPGVWSELSRTILTGTSDTIDSGTIDVKDNLLILCHTISGATTVTGNFRYNGVSAADYARRNSQNGSSDGTGVNQTQIIAGWGETGEDTFVVAWVRNTTGEEKQTLINLNANGTNGAGNAPNRREVAGKWADTSAPITSVQLENSDGGDFQADSEMIVLGYSPGDTPTAFFEELASVELGSAGTIDTGTFSTKKFLWVEFLTANDSVTSNYAIRFNNTSNSEYSFRYNINGGTDAATADREAIQTMVSGSSGQFWNGTTVFISNSADAEKLAIVWNNADVTTGAANAPSRDEIVGKWANTSNQISQIQLCNDSGLLLDQKAKSILKVWGGG